MQNLLTVFFYIINDLNGTIWFFTIITPLFCVIVLCLALNFTVYGRVIRSALSAKRFVRINGLITHQNKEIFYDKCIKRLPCSFAVAYSAYVKGDTPFVQHDIKPLFKGAKPFILAIFDGIWIIMLVITMIIMIIEGAPGALLLFCAITPLPLIIINRILFIGILYLYENRARASSAKIVSIINNEWNGRRFIEDMQNEVS